MDPKYSTAAKPVYVPTATRYRPFTRFDHNRPATTDEFDREQLGVAAKE
jgi:hypothetical protein